MTKEACLSQVNYMERHCGLHFSQEQKALYIALRDSCRENGGLCDQQLLAEIISLTDIASLAIFTKAYPNIFNI